MPYYIGGGVLAVCLIGGIIALIGRRRQKERGGSARDRQGTC